MKAIRTFFSTDQSSWALLFVRLSLAAVVLPHGMQKALGLFGGYGFEQTLAYFQSSGMPLLLGVMVILAEFVGSLGVIFGLGTRFMAFSVGITMFGAMFLGGHVQNGFFMNWFGNQAGEGMEYFIVVIGSAIALMIGGGGKLALDNLIVRWLPKK